MICREEGMQLVQQSKFFSVTIFSSIGSIGMRACEPVLFLVTVTMGVACPLLRRSIYKPLVAPTCMKGLCQCSFFLTCAISFLQV